MLLGRGTAAAIERLAKHITGCPMCAEVAEMISLDSGVASGFRRDDLPLPPNDHELADVFARVGQIDRSSWGGRSGTARPDVDVPERLGPYRLVELLGAGGMGAVYRAEDTALHRLVAVKVIKGGADAETRTRFLREARALAAVRHDNIVTIYFVGEEPGARGPIPYLAMELLEGQTLRDWMASASLPAVEWAIQAGRQIAAGLAFVHDAGMVHCDVKPANLWLEAPQGWANRSSETRPQHAAIGRVKLLDFGLAHQLDPLIKVGAAGTPEYMAPEQARGEVVDARADLYSLGCVLYELCTGRLPFPKRNLLWTGRDAKLAPVRSLNSEVPERFASLIERLLAADRADRPPSARVVELELAGLDVHSPGTPTVSRHSDATVVIPRRNRIRGRPLILAVLLIAAVSMIVVFADTGRKMLFPHRSNDVAMSPPMAGAATQEPSVADSLNALNSTGEIDEQWRREVATLPPQRQLDEVLRALGRLNPMFDWLKGSGWVEPYGVIRITVDVDTVSDLRPLDVLTTLRVLRCRGSAAGLGLVTDLSPLSTLTLTELHCRNNPGLSDLSPVRLKNLEFLDASYTGLKSLGGLTEAPLVTLKIAGTQVNDLGPVRKIAELKSLDCSDCPITDFTPLTAIPLRELRANVRADRDLAVLQRVKTLVTINRVPVKEYWKQHPVGKLD